MEIDLDTATIGGQLSPVHPGKVLKYNVLPRLKLSQEAAREKLGLSRQRFAGVLDGSERVDEALAMKIAKLAGGPAEIWLRMQSAFELANEQQLRGPGLR